MTAHWGVPDPAEAKGTDAEIALAFKDAPYRDAEPAHRSIAAFAVTGTLDAPQPAGKTQTRLATGDDVVAAQRNVAEGRDSLFIAGVDQLGHHGGKTRGR